MHYFTVMEKSLFKNIDRFLLKSTRLFFGTLQFLNSILPLNSNTVWSFYEVFFPSGPRQYDCFCSTDQKTGSWA